MKYNTKPIDFTGCHPVIAEHLKRGEKIVCKVWDDGHPREEIRFVVSYCHKTYVSEGIIEWDHAEPLPRKVLRIMPPERAIQVLIAEGWKFSTSGELVGRWPNILPVMFPFMGRVLAGEAVCFNWPPCIIEEVEDAE